MLKKIKEKLMCAGGKARRFFSAHPAAAVLISALSVAFVNEILSRRSFIGAVVFLFTKPHLFLCSAAVIFVFASPALFSRRWKFTLTVISSVFLLLGITDFVVRCFRQTPFSWIDVALVRSVFPILAVYLSVFGVIALAVLLVALAVLIFIRRSKAKKTPVNVRYSAVTTVSALAAAAAVIGICYGTGSFPGRFPNQLSDTYRDYGFTYCFLAGIVDRGISKPSGYDNDFRDVISDIISDEPTKTPGRDTTDSAPDQPPEQLPNIIFVQLESFFDPSYLKGFSFSENPTPVFSELKKNYSHGRLRVPTYGGGTANTEFEVLTGMRICDFGPSEYPYQTVLQKSTCESVCYNLSAHGYTAHAVHNYRANFYDRVKVYGNLGFNTFTPIEYMSGTEVNPLGWADDSVLTRYVISAMDSTDGPDLVYCVTVQSHGKYPTVPFRNTEDRIKVTDLPEDYPEVPLTYYLNQLRQTDEFIGELISAVEKTGEDTVIVFFGDHLPDLGFEEEWLKDGMTIYDTEYVIWSSRGRIGDNENLFSYQLSAKTVSLFGISDGVLTKFHQTWRGKKNYEKYLEMIEYDLLYGECFAYGGSNPFAVTEVKLGVRDIVITGAGNTGSGAVISGRGFTEASRIYVNGIVRKTVYDGENTLTAPGLKLKDGDALTVVQISDGIFRLGQTDEYIFRSEKGDSSLKGIADSRFLCYN